MANILWLQELRIQDIERVGGKNASLGEMLSNLSAMGVRVPNGFATTAEAYRKFLGQSGLNDKIHNVLATLDVEDVKKLAQVGASIRSWIIEAELPQDLVDDIRQAYAKLSEKKEASVAVRSSATAEDLPEASFAGQQETFLNVRGIDTVLEKVKHVFASLFNDRAIAYRVHQKFDHRKVALSAGIQKMVRSDLASSGVMFTLDTESGFEDVVLITSAYGLGETVVQGAVNPDEFYVYKPNLASQRPAVLRRTMGQKATKMIYGEGDGKLVQVVEVPLTEQKRFSLTEKEIVELAKQALLIEQHYHRPMDIEWAKDGEDGKLYIVQARPETVRSRDDAQVIERYELQEQSKVLIEGRSIGQKIGQGAVKVILDAKDMARVNVGDVLVTDMTDPDWEPVMKRAAAIVTNRGGRTCHAAIIARELGIPAVVGCQHATKVLRDGQEVTVSCAQGDIGYIYEGKLPFVVREVNLKSMPTLPFKIMMNVGNPERAFDFQKLPNAGVGLARLEFIINRMIGVHPKALFAYPNLPEEIKAEVEDKMAGFNSPIEFYVEKLVEGISTIAAAFAPRPVIVRLSDFKSNEYANLVGGQLFEPKEENPMLGFRGASRYVSDSFKECFALECKALKKVRDDMGFKNVQVMVPFVRTVSEAEQVVALLAQYGLKRGENDLQVIMMCELPTNALLAKDYLQHFDGFSIGSNDLTQLTLGLDRDSGLVAAQFDERDKAVKALLHMAISACKEEGKYIGICGQGPSDHPDFAKWLMQEGIDSVSLNPDSVLETWLFLAK